MARFSSSFWGGTEGPATSAAGAGRPSIGEAGTCAGLAGVCDATGSGPAVELAGGSEWRGGDGGELAGVVELAGGSAWEGAVELAGVVELAGSSAWEGVVEFAGGSVRVVELAGASGAAAGRGSMTGGAGPCARLRWPQARPRSRSYLRGADLPQADASACRPAPASTCARRPRLPRGRTSSCNSQT